MKKHNIAKVVLITILVIALLSWIIPAAYYSGSYVDQGRVQMGLFDLFNYPLTALSYFGYIALFLILVGGFYGVLYRIPAYRSFLDKIVKIMEGKEKIYLSLMIIIIAVLVSVCGLQIGIAIFIPFIVSLVILMGYDKITAAFVTVGSIAAGLIGTTVSATNTSVLTQSLSLKFDYDLGVRIVILIAAIILVIFNTLVYIKNSMNNVKIEKKTVKKAQESVSEVKVEENKTSSSKSTKGKSTKSGKSSSKKTTSKSSKSKNKAALKDEDIIVVKENESDDLSLVPRNVSEKHSIWPFVTGFILLLILVVLAFISWGDTGLKVSLFDDVTKNVTEFKIFGFALFGKLLGTINAFGSWSLTDMFLPMALLIIILMIIYKVKVDDAIDGFVDGAKRALGPAVIVLLLYTVLVIVTYHPFQLVIYKTILGLAKGFNIATTTLVAIIASILNVDAAYTFQSIVPYYASVVSAKDSYPLVAVIFQSMYGLAMLAAPTSLVLMASLSYLKVSYKEWLKAIWKLLLELFVILLIVFIIYTIL